MLVICGIIITYAITNPDMNIKKLKESLFHRVVVSVYLITILVLLGFWLVGLFQ